MKLCFNKQVVNITCNRLEPRAVPVEALVFEDFAIHHPVTGGRGYYVTHLHTGIALAFRRNLPAAKMLVQELHQLGLNWKFTALEMPADVYDAAMPIIRK